MDSWMGGCYFFVFSFTLIGWNRQVGTEFMAERKAERPLIHLLYLLPLLGLFGTSFMEIVSVKPWFSQEPRPYLLR